jgi:predicted TIM-barrel fold metal-dependent hydrolase
MPSRDLDFPVFDADNHMYEKPEAFTKYLPKEYEGFIKYVQVNGRTKIAVNNKISDYIPNPTFEVVAAPGAQETYFKEGNPEGKSRREILGKGIRAHPGFGDPEPRMELLNELGIDRAVLWPTLASLLEERVHDNPPAVHAVVHALNQWMEEHWTFNYENRLFPTPVIHLGIVDEAIKELDWVVERGARIILVRPAPVWGFMGPRSPALPEFDPFWSKVAEAGLLVGMHSSDSGYQRYTNEWEGIKDGEMTPFKGGSGFAAITGHAGRPIIDTISSLIGHGLCSRFPTLRFTPVENGSNWVRPLLLDMEYAYHHSPNVFAENPVDVFKRNIYVHPFHEEDPKGLIELLGADRVLFGSDYPHPEGMSDPITFVDDLQGLPEEDIKLVMGGNLNRLMGLDSARVAA